MSKTKLSVTAWILIGLGGFIFMILLIFGLSMLRNFNKMAAGEVDIEAQWAQVENVYQRRADLIPNLVNTVKGYAEHEQETLTEVINARAKATSVNINPSNLNPASIQQFQQAQAGLSSALGKLMVVVERYPNLKANQNFLELQAQLEGTENRIAAERKRYNDVVRLYNRRIKTFPGRFYNRFFGFEEKGYFEAVEGADVAPTVYSD